jgi:hypothetical protein
MFRPPSIDKLVVQTLILAPHISLRQKCYRQHYRYKQRLLYEKFARRSDAK